MANPKAWRNAILVGAVVGVVVLLGGLGVYRLGFSQGSAAAINEVCVAGAIKDQDGGRSCAFWLVPPNQPGQRKG